MSKSRKFVFTITFFALIAGLLFPWRCLKWNDEHRRFLRPWILKSNEQVKVKSAPSFTWDDLIHQMSETSFDESESKWFLELTGKTPIESTEEFRKLPADDPIRGLLEAVGNPDWYSVDFAWGMQAGEFLLFMFLFFFISRKGKTNHLDANHG